MLNSTFKKIAISLGGSAKSSFSLFSGRGSLRDSKIAESVAQGTQQKDEKRSKSSSRVSKFKLFAVLWSRQPSGLENCWKRSPRDTAKGRKACQKLPKSSPSAPQSASKSLQNAVLELPMASRS